MSTSLAKMRRNVATVNQTERRRCSQTRQPRGNMLVLVCLTIGVIVLLGLIGLTFNTFLFQRTQAQYKVDALALSLASSINSGDRVGQINELVESSRELVHVSRANERECDQLEMRGYMPLCTQLIDEARAGHALVERERQNQARLVMREMQDAATKFNAEADGTKPFLVGCLQTQEPRIERIDVGHLINVDSNVRSLDAIPELAEYDRKHGIVTGGSNLFRCDNSAKLPFGDGDLDFNLASLPAYVDGTCAPARNANPEMFHSTACIFADGRPTPETFFDRIPSAVQLRCALDTAFGRDRENHASVKLFSTGITSGAVAGAD